MLVDTLVNEYEEAIDGGFIVCRRMNKIFKPTIL